MIIHSDLIFVQKYFIKFSYHFLLSDAQPDFSETFHQDFSHIAQAR